MNSYNTQYTIYWKEREKTTRAITSNYFSIPCDFFSTLFFSAVCIYWSTDFNHSAGYIWSSCFSFIQFCFGWIFFSNHYYFAFALKITICILIWEIPLKSNNRSYEKIENVGVRGSSNQNTYRGKERRKQIKKKGYAFWLYFEYFHRRKILFKC